MTDRRSDRASAPRPSQEIQDRARDGDPVPDTPVQGASKAGTPPRPPRGRTDPKQTPPLPPGAR